MGVKKVLVGGCFDILHVGHVGFLKKARSFGDYLIVLLESDENIKKLKGKGKPIFNLKERIAVLKAIKYVDKIIVVAKNPTHETYLKLIKKIKPNIIAITEGDILEKHKLNQAKLVGAKLKVIKKYKNYSSSKVVNYFFETRGESLKKAI